MTDDERSRRALSDDPLPMWTIYERPRDHPAGFVVRLWYITHDGVMPSREAFVDLPTLEAARACIPSGLARLPRQPDDDPAIVETWV